MKKQKIDKCSNAMSIFWYNGPNIECVRLGLISFNAVNGTSNLEYFKNHTCWDCLPFVFMFVYTLTKCRGNSKSLFKSTLTPVTYFVHCFMKNTEMWKGNIFGWSLDMWELFWGSALWYEVVKSFY